MDMNYEDLPSSQRIISAAISQKSDLISFRVKYDSLLTQITEHFNLAESELVGVGFCDCDVAACEWEFDNINKRVLVFVDGIGGVNL
jgi:hypothetical protein